MWNNPAIGQSGNRAIGQSGNRDSGFRIPGLWWDSGFNGFRCCYRVPGVQQYDVQDIGVLQNVKLLVQYLTINEGRIPIPLWVWLVCC